jgi:hypothetical protein
VLFDKAPHRGGNGGGSGSGSNDSLNINSTLPPSRMATIASAWASKLRGRARFGLALCGGHSSNHSSNRSPDPCLAEGVEWLPEVRVYGTGKVSSTSYPTHILLPHSPFSHHSSLLPAITPPPLHVPSTLSLLVSLYPSFRGLVRVTR